MSKILVDTIDTRSGTSNITIGSTNASQITLKSGATLTNFPANTPAFEANLGSDQTVSDNTFTKLNINTEVFDTDSKYDTSNYRFTPTVAGKYYVYGSVHGETDASQMQLCQGAIYKNGSAYAINIIDFRSNNGLQSNVFVAVTMDLDTDDYVELYGKIYKGGGSTIRFLSGTTNTFGAYRIIGA